MKQRLCSRQVATVAMLSSGFSRSARFARCKLGVLDPLVRRPVVLLLESGNLGQATNAVTGTRLWAFAGATFSNVEVAAPRLPTLAEKHHSGEIGPPKACDRRLSQCYVSPNLLENNEVRILDSHSALALGLHH